MDRAEERGLAAVAAVHAHAVAVRRVRKPERPHDHAARLDHAQRRATPRLGERVEPLLEEAFAREDAAALETLHDLLVQQRKDLPVDGEVPLAAGDGGGRQARPRELPEAVEPIHRRPGERRDRRRQQAHGPDDPHEQARGEPAGHEAYGTTAREAAG